MATLEGGHEKGLHELDLASVNSYLVVRTDTGHVEEIEWSAGIVLCRWIIFALHLSYIVVLLLTVWRRFSNGALVFLLAVFPSIAAIVGLSVVEFSFVQFLALLFAMIYNVCLTVRYCLLCTVDISVLLGVIRHEPLKSDDLFKLLANAVAMIPTTMLGYIIAFIWAAFSSILMLVWGFYGGSPYSYFLGHYFLDTALLVRPAGFVGLVFYCIRID